ncbi:MAG TPA: carbohydrate ABC transporter permease [Candidatus Acetothermia bacterium]|nr:carbohydrate ABC transporter permease [Candidatus Acetothermia bacterium]
MKEREPVKRGYSYKAQRRAYLFTTYFLLLVGAIVMLLPFLWMISTSFKPLSQTLTMPPKLIPSIFRWQNYVEAWNTAPFGKYFFNSFFIAIVETICEVIATIFAAYAFAKMDFFGKNVIFVAFLGTMMIPGEMLLVPNYITLTSFHWIDTYYALIVPFIVSVFGIFLLRQFFLSIPDELWDAARIDGSGRLGFLWRIIVPISRPGITAVALFKFIGSWNAFMWVLIVTNTPTMRTVPVGLSYFRTAAGTYFNQLMAAATMGMLPILILFFFAQKQFIQGIARSGIK